MATPLFAATVPSPYINTGNGKDKGITDTSIWAPLACAAGGQVGRYVAGPPAPITQYWDSMAAGLLAGLAVNYAAVSSDGTRWPFKDPFAKLKAAKGDATVADTALFASISGKESWCYVRRGGKEGYWMQGQCIGAFPNTSIMIGHDTIVQILVASAVLLWLHGGIRKNMREIAGMLAGMTLGSEGIARWQGSNYVNEVRFGDTGGNGGDYSTGVKDATGYRYGVLGTKANIAGGLVDSNAIGRYSIQKGGAATANPSGWGT